MEATRLNKITKLGCDLTAMYLSDHFGRQGSKSFVKHDANIALLYAVVNSTSTGEANTNAGTITACSTTGAKANAGTTTALQHRRRPDQQRPPTTRTPGSHRADTHQDMDNIKNLVEQPAHRKTHGHSHHHQRRHRPRKHHEHSPCHPSKGRYGPLLWPGQCPKEEQTSSQ